MKTRPMISIKDVVKGFHDRKQVMPSWFIAKNKRNIFYAVKNVSLEIKKNEIFGILGPNGCGKSTLIRMMTTLLTPDKGSLHIKDMDVIENVEEIKKIINRVSVEASFFKRLSAKENLLYASRLYGLNDRESTQKFIGILEQLGFPRDKINEPMLKFSRGMQQKVSIARGFITNPEIIMLDEPTTGLDPKSKIDVQKFITNIHSKRDLTIVISSHDMNEVEKLCDRIAIMDKGKVIALGTSEELKRMMSEGNIYELESSDAEKAKQALDDLGLVENLELEKGKVRFQAEDIDLIAYKITKSMKEQGIKFQNLKRIEPSLEDVFLYLTGKSLEDEE